MQELTGGPDALTLNPALTVNSIPLYIGKVYRLYASSKQAHSLTLPGAYFYGTGAASPATVGTFNAVSVGEGLTLMVMSATVVQVSGVLGITWS